MSEILIIHNSGWIGSGERPAPERIKPIQQQITINEADWDTRNLLMPVFVREVMRGQQELSADQDLLHRDYAPETDINILLPAGVRGISR
jgi:hypothetical protein